MGMVRSHTADKDSPATTSCLLGAWTNTTFAARANDTNEYQLKNPKRSKMMVANTGPVPPAAAIPNAIGSIPVVFRDKRHIHNTHNTQDKYSSVRHCSWTRNGGRVFQQALPLLLLLLTMWTKICQNIGNGCGCCHEFLFVRMVVLDRCRCCRTPRLRGFGL